MKVIYKRILKIWQEQIIPQECKYGIIQGDSFGTRPKKMRVSQRLFIRF